MLKVEFQDKLRWEIEGDAADLMALAILCVRAAGMTRKDLSEKVPISTLKGPHKAEKQVTRLNFDGELITVYLSKGQSRSAL